MARLAALRRAGFAGVRGLERSSDWAAVTAAALADVAACRADVAMITREMMGGVIKSAAAAATAEKERVRLAAALEKECRARRRAFNALQVRRGEG